MEPLTLTPILTLNDYCKILPLDICIANFAGIRCRGSRWSIFSPRLLSKHNNKTTFLRCLPLFLMVQIRTVTIAAFTKIMLYQNIVTNIYFQRLIQISHEKMYSRDICNKSFVHKIKLQGHFQSDMI